MWCYLKIWQIWCIKCRMIFFGEQTIVAHIFLFVGSGMMRIMWDTRTWFRSRNMMSSEVQRMKSLLRLSVLIFGMLVRCFKRVTSLNKLSPLVKVILSFWYQSWRIPFQRTGLIWSPILVLWIHFDSSQNIADNCSFLHGVQKFGTVHFLKWKSSNWS